MKRWVFIITIISCVLCACVKAPASEVNQDENKIWSEEDVIQLFVDNNKGYEVLDCALVTDGNVDGIGVVLFADESRNSTYVGFIEKSGYTKSIGIDVVANEENQIAYLGAGKVQVTIKDSADSFVVKYSMDYNRVKWNINNRE